MINQTLSTLTEPLGTAVGDFIGVLITLVGGIFGLYIIYTVFLVLKWRETKKLKKKIIQMDSDILALKKTVESFKKKQANKTKKKSTPKKS